MKKTGNMRNRIRLFFNKIGNLISEKPTKSENKGLETEANLSDDIMEESEFEDRSKETVPDKEKVTTKKRKEDVPFVSREELEMILRKEISELFRNAGTGVHKHLIVWLNTDNPTFQVYDELDYKKKLQEALSTDSGVIFDSVSFYNGRPIDEHKCRPLGDSNNVFYRFEDKQPTCKEIPKKAIISIYGNAGSLKKERYIISTEEMKKKGIIAYNIGVGEYPEKYPPRQNHIVIDDNPQSSMYEINKYVSGSHAHIGFSDRLGFYLQIETNSKKNAIVRHKEGSEQTLSSPFALEPLQNGDLVILGKLVLRFVES